MLRYRAAGFVVVGLVALGSRPQAAERGDTLHRMTLLRAAPGRLSELIQAVRTAADGDAAKPLLLRHSQGDQWDLMRLAPIGSYAAHFAALRTVPPLVPQELVAWQEDEFVRGPDIASLEGFREAGLYHVEMFQALADKRPALLREREMENEYLRAVGRPTTAIFTRELGASWDVFTIGAYRSWKHYAERDDVPKQRSAAAARAAGFESDDAISPYLRSLILSHHDTLTTPLR